MSLRAEPGNVAAESLRPIVESDHLRSLWSLTIDDVPVGSECEFRYTCQVCRAIPCLLMGDLRQRDPTCPYDPQTGQWCRRKSALASRPRQRSELRAEALDDSLVVADARSAQLHLLSPDGAAIWEMCDGERAAEQMAAMLAEHFDIGVEEIRSDVAKTLAELQEKGLVE